jgi:NAD(P)H-hydrate repair Nnr-like enzyme with NAD(P)H-hydrate epimerase domain
MYTVTVGMSASASPSAPGAALLQSGIVVGSGNNGAGRVVCGAAAAEAPATVKALNTI